MGLKRELCKSKIKKTFYNKNFHQIQKKELPYYGYISNKEILFFLIEDIVFLGEK